MTDFTIGFLLGFGIGAIVAVGASVLHFMSALRLMYAQVLSLKQQIRRQAE